MLGDYQGVTPVEDMKGNRGKLSQTLAVDRKLVKFD